MGGQIHELVGAEREKTEAAHRVRITNGKCNEKEKKKPTVGEMNVSYFCE
jgi:hypothetical protein